jgi:hypothetical protein
MIVMYDSIVPSMLPEVKADAYAGYVDGTWNDYAEIVKTHPGSNVLSIAVNADADADCLDIERGDADISALADGLWYARQIKRGVQRPCFYMSASLLSTAQGYLRHLPRSSYRIWSAHYTNKHMCGPKTCGYGLSDVDGTQWSSGESFDTSELNDNFFTIIKNDVPSWELAMMSAMPVLKLGDKDGTGVEWIHRIQLLLSGIFGYPLTADGIFGPRTQSAVKLLEKRYGLPENGTVNESEWQVLVTGSHS